MAHAPEAAMQVAKSLADLDTAACACFSAIDKERILSFIQEAYGDLTSFNKAVKELLDAPRIRQQLQGAISAEHGVRIQALEGKVIDLVQELRSTQREQRCTQQELRSTQQELRSAQQELAQVWTQWGMHSPQGQIRPCLPSEIHPDPEYLQQQTSSATTSTREAWPPQEWQHGSAELQMRSIVPLAPPQNPSTCHSDWYVARGSQDSCRKQHPKQVDALP